MANNVVAVVPVLDGTVNRSSLEAVSEAARLAGGLGGEAIALAIGPGAAAAAAALGKNGAKRAVAIEADGLAPYNGDVWGKVCADAIGGLGAGAVVLMASAIGKDLAPRIAAHLDTGYAGDVTAASASGGAVTATRPVYAGKAYTDIKFEASPAVLSLRPNNFQIDDGGPDAAVESIAASLPEVRSKVTSVAKASEGTKVDLTEASRVVSGGRGLKGPENFGILESLAKVIGATVGASRAVVDAGWRGHGDQIGQTGKTISPNLYIGAGISGAIQHLAGMQTAKCIVAINKDPEAPIFKIADYGIVGDLFEVVPALEAELKKALG